jgi:ORF6N domain
MGPVKRRMQKSSGAGRLLRPNGCGRMPEGSQLFRVVADNLACDVHPASFLLVPLELVERTILILRGRRVILDSELAALYGASAKRLNEQVKRNAERFPADFAFKLTPEEFGTLRSQFATSKPERRGGRRTLPTAFTEHGALMAASVLNSAKAVEMSIQVVRAFVRLRHFLASHHQLAAKLDELERRIATHDTRIVALFDDP